MGNQVEQKVSLIDDDEKEERDVNFLESLVWKLFVQLRSAQECTRGWWEMK